MDLSYLKINQSQAPWISLDAETAHSPTIHLSPANGFKAASYRSFMNGFDGQYHFTGMDCRGSWPNTASPNEKFTMHDFADDLIEGLQQAHSSPVIGLGHSQGGFVTLIAAIKRPDLFSKLVLIEPASLPNPWIDRIYPYIPKSVLYAWPSLIKGSLNRQKYWETKHQFYQRYREHGTFKRFTEHAFEDYMEFGLREHNSGWELTFSPEWEAHIFRKVEFIWKYLNNIKIPTLFIKAQHSNLYTKKCFDRQNKSLNSFISTIEINNTYHLLPNEQPEICIKTITNWLED